MWVNVFLWMKTKKRMNKKKKQFPKNRLTDNGIHKKLSFFSLNTYRYSGICRSFIHRTNQYGIIIYNAFILFFMCWPNKYRMIVTYSLVLVQFCAFHSINLNVKTFAPFCNSSSSSTSLFLFCSFKPVKNLNIKSWFSLWKIEIRMFVVGSFSFYVFRFLVIWFFLGCKVSNQMPSSF